MVTERSRSDLQGKTKQYDIIKITRGPQYGQPCRGVSPEFGEIVRIDRNAVQSLQRSADRQKKPSEGGTPLFSQKADRALCRHFLELAGQKRLQLHPLHSPTLAQHQQRHFGRLDAVQ